ncbi:MAG: FAD-dependent urate hydroxylase HpxO [Cyanobacteria bacterium J06635_15]
MDNLNVVIIGAGIGGLTTGIAMQQAGYTVEIYDRVRELRPAGAGISLWSNGVKVLNRLGLGSKIAAIGGEMNRMAYRSHTDELLSDIDLTPLIEQVGQRPYPVARTDLQGMLRNVFGADKVHLQMRCVAVEQDEHSATAIFEDGTRVRGDLVVGADGVHSCLRTHVLGYQASPRFANYVNWNGLVEANPAMGDEDAWILYVGDARRASWMPVGEKRFYYFFGCPMVAGTTVEPAHRQAELAKIFAGWPEPVQTLIEQLDPLQTNRLEISDLDPLEALVKGRVVLVGDSGHATTPTLGQGGCQAMEDAEILTRYLLTTNISVADALKRYEAARKERTAKLTLKARKRTATIYGQDPAATAQWYDEMRAEKPSDVTDAIAKIILGGPLG